MRTRSLASHLDDLRGHLGDARSHHADVVRSLRRDDFEGAERSHRRLGACLDRAERCLRAIANEGMLKDIANHQKAQMSDGMGYGTSGGARSCSAPLSRHLSHAERLARAAQLQGPPVGDGGAGGIVASRNYEFLRAQAHYEAVFRARQR